MYLVISVKKKRLPDKNRLSTTASLFFCLFRGRPRINGQLIRHLFIRWSIALGWGMTWTPSRARVLTGSHRASIPWLLKTVKTCSICMCLAAFWITRDICTNLNWKQRTKVHYHLIIFRPQTAAHHQVVIRPGNCQKTKGACVMKVFGSFVSAVQVFKTLRLDWLMLLWNSTCAQPRCRLGLKMTRLVN